jgi:hypothetical protein
MATADGIDAYMAGIQKTAETVDGAKEQRVVADDAEVCIIYDLFTKSGDIPTVGWHHVRGEEIASLLQI